MDGGLNAYAYCSCDPINLVDPTGRAPLPADVLAKIRVIAKNKVILDQKRSPLTQRLKTATAEYARLADTYKGVDAKYGLNQKAQDGSKIKHHEATIARASKEKSDMVNQRATQKELIANAESSIKILEQRWQVNVQALGDLSSVYGEVAVTKEFDSTVKSLRQPLEG